MRYFLSMVLVSMVFAAAVNAQIDLAERHFKTAAEHVSMRDYENAILSYEKALQIAEASSGAGLKGFISKIDYNIGVCFYKLGDFPRAERYLSKAIIIDPAEDNKKYFALSLAQIELGKFSEAKKTLRIVLRNDKKHGEAWFEMGMIYLNESSLSKAKEAFLISAKIEGFRRSEAVNNVGVIMAMEGDLRLAEVAFEKAFLLSGKTLYAAKRNFEFCRKHTNAPLQKLVSKLIIAAKKGNVTG